MGWIVIIFLRLLVPLSILKYPLWGTILSIISDAIDWPLLSSLGIDYQTKYQGFDKVLDSYFCAIQAITLVDWKHAVAKQIGYILFTHRIFGVILFELTKNRLILIAFPNMFLEFFLLYLIFMRAKKTDWLSVPKYAATFLILLALYKLTQEYMLHSLEFPFHQFAFDLASRVVYAQ